MQEQDLMMSDEILSKEGSSHAHLEPRVAKLEMGMQRLTDDVRDLAHVVRAQGTQMEQEIQKLVVSVTQAAGPRKTEWSTIIAAIMLMLAIGSAVFWPLNQMTQDNKIRIEAYHQSMVEHQKLDLHPVGAALMQRLEEQYKLHTESDNKVHSDLRMYSHEENAAFQKYIDEKITINTKVQDAINERIYSMISKLEDHNARLTEKDMAELMQWRQKAMGLNK